MNFTPRVKRYASLGDRTDARARVPVERFKGARRAGRATNIVDAACIYSMFRRERALPATALFDQTVRMVFVAGSKNLNTAFVTSGHFFPAWKLLYLSPVRSAR